MTSNVTEYLFSLAEIDREIHQANTRKNEILGRLNTTIEDRDQAQSTLAQLDAKLQEGTDRQHTDEERLKDEEKKIVERRKQLNALGGIRGARLVEREIDIATRVMQSMEEQALKSIEEVEQLKSLREEISTKLETLKSEVQGLSQETEQEVGEIDSRLSELDKQRGGIVQNLGERLERLYQKVSTRFPGDAVAVAGKGACRSCYRALPPQTYNQVLAGNMLIQCPGCMRILVHVAEEG